MKVVEMFTGIGSQAKALSKVSKKHGIQFDIVKTCEWDIHAIIAYHLIHNSQPISEDILKMSKIEIINILSNLPISSNGKNTINENYLKSLKIEVLRLILHSIKNNDNLLDIKKVTGKDIPLNTDLITYSFPCQDLSNVGSFHGYKNGIDKGKNTRSGLLWEVERILEEINEEGLIMPKFLLLENVTALEAKRHLSNFNEWQDKLIKLGYINKIYKLNSEDFGIPQYRKRLIMLSVYVGDDEVLKSLIEDYWIKNNLNNQEFIETLNLEKIPLNRLLRLDYTNRKFFNEALEAQPNNTKSRVKIWERNSKILDENLKLNQRVQTITTRQDRHPNSGNIYFPIDNGKSNYRFLTSRECFLLMGFDETDYEKLIDNNMNTRGKSLFFSRDILYKLAGNSIVVNILEAVFNQMLAIKKIVNDYEHNRKNIVLENEINKNDDLFV